MTLSVKFKKSNLELRLNLNVQTYCVTLEKQIWLKTCCTVQFIEPKEALLKKQSKRLLLLLPSEHFHKIQLNIKAMQCPISEHHSLKVRVHLQHIIVTENVQIAHKRTSTTL